MGCINIRGTEALTSVAGAAAAAMASIPGGFMYMNWTPCRSLNFVCSSGPRKDSVCKYSCSARNSACTCDHPQSGHNKCLQKQLIFTRSPCHFDASFLSGQPAAHKGMQPPLTTIHQRADLLTFRILCSGHCGFCDTNPSRFMHAAQTLARNGRFHLCIAVPSLSITLAISRRFASSIFCC